RAMRSCQLASERKCCPSFSGDMAGKCTKSSGLSRAPYASRRVLDAGKGFQYGGSFERGDMKILFVASEGLPFSKTGGLADVIEALSRSIAELGHEVAVLLPPYRDAPVLAVASQKVTVSMGGGPRFPVIASGVSLHGVRYY